jgi:hypothetical protein
LFNDSPVLDLDGGLLIGEFSGLTSRNPLCLSRIEGVNGHIMFTSPALVDSFHWFHFAFL